MVEQGLSVEQARAMFWVCDKDGLVTADREGLHDLDPAAALFARKDTGARGGAARDGMTLEEVGGGEGCCTAAPPAPVAAAPSPPKTVHAAPRLSHPACPKGGGGVQGHGPPRAERDPRHFHRGPCALRTAVRRGRQGPRHRLPSLQPHGQRRVHGRTGVIPPPTAAGLSRGCPRGAPKKVKIQGTGDRAARPPGP